MSKDYSLDKDNDWKISKSRKAGALLLPIPEGKEIYAEYENLCIEYYFNDEALNTKTVDGKGLIFNFLEKVTMIGSKKSVEPSTLLETRKIANGKKIFSQFIVPELESSEFEAFKTSYILSSPNLG